MTSTLVNNAAAVEAFLQKHQTIQALPESAIQAMRLTRDPNCTVEQWVTLIERDGALASAIMKTVNSAFYSLPVKMTRLDRAVAYLGMKTVKEVATATCLSKMCKEADYGRYTSRDLWDHGIGVGIVARELAVRSKKFDSEECFLAGVLHDIGLMLAAQSEIARGTELLTRAEAGEGVFADLELRLFEFSHCELGASLATKWRFSDEHVMAIQFHHHPNEAPAEFRAFCHHLYIADTLACEGKIGCPLTAKSQVAEEEHLEAAQVSREMIEEVMKKLPLLARLHLH